MFGLKSLKTFSNLTLPITNLQILRWRRKPRWIPIANSRLYKIPVKPVISIDEEIEMTRLNNNYKCYMKTIKKYLNSKYIAAISITTDPKDQLRVFEEDFERCNKINAEWNLNVERDRQKYFEDLLEKDINVAEDALIKREQIRTLQLEEAERLVREQKEAAKHFITADNIDAAIEHALANPVDYNFAIDLEGNKHSNNNKL